MITDFLGTEIKVGQRAIFLGPWSFKKASVVAVDATKGSQSVQIQSDDSTRKGWTFPSSLVVSDNFSKKF